MAWQDKTLEAKYTAPSGTEFPFLYEKVSRETELKTGIFTFPDRDGAHVQHQGAGARSFPLTCIFSGPDCMDQADAFEAALCERDVAELQHPTYGIIKVIPTGNIKREDDLVSALNESRVTITFTETITEDVTPMETVSVDEINETFEEFSESAALDFAENISVDTVAEELQLQSVLEVQAQLLDDNMIPLVESDTSALANFRTASGEFKSAIKELKHSKILGVIAGAKNAAKMAENYLVKGLNVARLALNLMKLPSKIIVGVLEKVKGYSILVTNIASQFRNDPFGTKNVINAYHSTSLVLSGCLAALASGAAFSMAQATSNKNKTAINRSPAFSPAGIINPGADSPGLDNPGDNTVTNEIISREESFQVINNILTTFNVIKSFQDSKIEKNIIIDSNSNTHLLLSKLVYSSVQLIMNASLSLPMRRTIRLDQDRQLIELVCELYGSVDYIDKFIAENDLNLDEMEVLSMGREVTYYVQVA